MKVFRCLAFGLLFSSVCCAEDAVTKVEDKQEDTGKPEFKISGNAAFSTDFSFPDVAYYKGEVAPSDAKTSKDSSSPRAVAGEAEIVFEAKGKLQNGWIYGAKLTMDAHRKDTGIDKAYLFFERDNFGTLQAGNLKGPEHTMLCGGQQLLGGAAGMDGAVTSDINFATGLISPINMNGFSNKATKIVYYTPNIYGFKFGVSVTPDTKHSGHESKSIRTGDSRNGNNGDIYNRAKGEKERPSGRNNIGLGLSHEYKFTENTSYKIAAMGIFEDTRPITVIFANNGGQEKEATRIKLRNTCAFRTTASVTYKDFTVACGYLNNGKGRLPKKEVYEGKADDFIPGGFLVTKDGNAGQAWNVGAKYKYNKWEFSTVYHNMQRKVAKSEKVRGHALTLAVDYLVCAGLKIFAEFDYITSKSCDTACRMYNLTHEAKKAIKKQDAGAFILGAKVTF
jgi:hypothetical protein